MTGSRVALPPEDKVFTLQVSLMGTDPLIWRTVEISADDTLADLHYTLQCVMGWLESHLHEFIIKGKSYGRPDPEMEDTYDESQVRLTNVFKRKGSHIAYIYDFGDGWEHEVRLVAQSTAEPGVYYPRCIGGAQACPPEDCGGVYGYYNMLNVLKDPSHDDYEMYEEWLPEDFDPNRFDVDDANHALDSVNERRSESEFAPVIEREDRIIAESGYSERLCRLLALGEPGDWDARVYEDLDASHVGELIRMATDITLHEAPTESTRVWGPIHAWRALGVLKAADAIKPLVNLLTIADDGDEVDDLALTLAEFGVEAIPSLAAFIQNTSGRLSRMSAGIALGQLAEIHPGCREAAVAALTEPLTQLDDTDPAVNAALVWVLLTIGAEESDPVIQRALEVGAVDEVLLSGFQEAQEGIGMRQDLPENVTAGPWLDPPTQTKKKKSGSTTKKSGGKSKQKSTDQNQAPRGKGPKK